MDPEAWAAWEEFEKRCVNELSSRSSRIWGDYGDVRDRWQSCLKELESGHCFKPTGTRKEKSIRPKIRPKQTRHALFYLSVA